MCFYARKTQWMSMTKLMASVTRAGLSTLLENLPKGSIIVVDNASYQSRKLEFLPTASWRKENINELLTGKAITFEEDRLKRDLLFIVNQVWENFEEMKK